MFRFWVLVMVFFCVYSQFLFSERFQFCSPSFASGNPHTYTRTKIEFNKTENWKWNWNTEKVTRKLFCVPFGYTIDVQLKKKNSICYWVESMVCWCCCCCCYGGFFLHYFHHQWLGVLVPWRGAHEPFSLCLAVFGAVRHGKTTCPVCCSQWMLVVPMTIFSSNHSPDLQQACATHSLDVVTFIHIEKENHFTTQNRFDGCRECGKMKKKTITENVNQQIATI